MAWIKSAKMQTFQRLQRNKYEKKKFVCHKKITIFLNQVLKEILQVLDGTNMDVTRADSTETEYIDTSQIFFVVFGNFEENFNSRRASLVVQQEPKISPSSSQGSSDSGNGSGGGHHRNLMNDNNRRFSSDLR